MSIRDTSWKVFVILFLLGILGGVIGAALFGSFFGKTGPQGAQGLQGTQGQAGDQGLQGLQGIQGVPGRNGSNSIIQSFQNANATAIDATLFTSGQWSNISDFDSSMNLTISLQPNSKIYAQFSSTNDLSAPAAISYRIVVDQNITSSLVKIAPGPPSSNTFIVSGHVEFLTGSLSAGQHTIEVQLQKQGTGTAILSDRIFTVFEIASP